MKFIYILGGYLGLISGVVLLFNYFSENIANKIAQKTINNLKNFKSIRH